NGIRSRRYALRCIRLHQGPFGMRLRLWCSPRVSQDGEIRSAEPPAVARVRSAATRSWPLLLLRQEIPAASLSPPTLKKRHYTDLVWGMAMSALGQKQSMSALAPIATAKADFRSVSAPSIQQHEAGIPPQPQP